MSLTTYILDSALVLIVVLQIKERRFTNKTLIRPVVILGIAVGSYLHGIPAGGNDLILAGAVCAIGGAIGVASGLTVLLRVAGDGALMVRAGWASACLWVLGMGSRFAFAWWAAHGGAATIASFSAQHSITSGEAWTVALLGMAVFEVLGRTFVMAARRQRLCGAAGSGLAFGVQAG